MVSGVVCWVKGEDSQTTVLTNGGFSGCRMRVESVGKTSLVGAEESYQQVAVDTQWLIYDFKGVKGFQKGMKHIKYTKKGPVFSLFLQKMY